MSLDAKTLLTALRPLLKTLEADLMKRAKQPALETGLKARWQREKDAGRTGASFTLWRRRRMTQVAIAWILSVIFVRILEDRGFLPRRRIAGAGAEDSEQQFTAIAPFLTARDYLLTVFRELAQLPGAGDLFDARHNPVWVLAPSATAARQLLDFFRHGSKRQGPFDFSQTDTRYLGDLYQDLSEDVRDRYALWQTPVFVERFILSQTLDPAIDTFGLDDVRLIDPTCGSGHFLLGAFASLLDHWQRHAPGEDPQVLAQRALSQIAGCDLNPYAVAIARFRLTLAFLEAVGITRLSKAPRLPLNLCVADSLLHGVSEAQQRLSDLGDEQDRRDYYDQIFALEDEAAALRILEQRYHAVVGNPPYITEKDAKKRAQYRDLYESAAGKFALAAPFTERFFDLAVDSGFVGLINANSFTKRDFGKPLIEQVLPRLDLQKVVDTAGAYIPGHGTPTLLLFGRNRKADGAPVIAVLGKRGEATEPADPARAPVWSEILSHHQQPGYDGTYISVEAVPRADISQHPWILAGGGAQKLFKRLELRSKILLNDPCKSIGICSFTLEDDAFISNEKTWLRKKIEDSFLRPMVTGEKIRDWRLQFCDSAIFPYSADFAITGEEDQVYLKELWPNKTILSNNKLFAGKTKIQGGLSWYEYGRLTAQKLKTPLSIAFAFVATHNHFVLDRGGKVFNRTAPIIKLQDKYDESDHQALLGVLNSSTVALWCRLVMFPKAVQSRTPWENRLEYAGNLLKQLPLPDLAAAKRQLLPLVQRAEALVNNFQALDPQRGLAAALDQVTADSTTLAQWQTETSQQRETLRQQLVAIQEEIDWRVYGLYGLPSLPASDWQTADVAMAPEQRPFEIRLARQVNEDLSAQIWFERHRRSPPQAVTGPQAELYQQRLDLIDKDPQLQLLETPETKRRWMPHDHAGDFQQAYQDYLLARIEACFSEQPEPQILSVAQITLSLQTDPRVQWVAAAYLDEQAPNLEKLVDNLVKAQGVPFLAAYRYSATGMEKYADWCHTWDLQRREDAGEAVDKIPVPPKYATKDFRKASYWPLRGKLDVPKERFILIPNAGSEDDDSLHLGWAGWDHLQRARALAALYHEHKQAGTTTDTLLPLLAGLHEWVPWLQQWHNEPDPQFGGQRPGDAYRDFVSGEVQNLGKSRTDLENWRPAKPSRGKAKKELTADALLAALDPDGTARSQKDLAQHLGVSASQVGTLAKQLIAAGQVVQTNARPKQFAQNQEETNHE